MARLGQARNTGWVAEPAAPAAVTFVADAAAAAFADAAEALYAEVVVEKDEEVAAAAAAAVPVLGAVAVALAVVAEAVPGVETAGVAGEEAACSASSAGWDDLGDLYGGTQKSARVLAT
ncbi:hypothetical protein LPJ60_002401 [Coemansia sp. RSA 2675]|nr:hypothetical protein LPJ60_002401 [Coemansia sp. RSA 2675]